MKMLIAHNVYKQRGGEDAVFESETRLLREHGHDVTLMLANNKDVNTTLRKINTALGTPFSMSTYWKTRSNLRKNKVELMHVHNFFPKYSPSIFYAARSMGVPSILTLHNFRIICPTATLMHNGKVDERSIANGPLWTVRNRVYRNSYMGTAAVTAMVQLHKLLRTWRHQVNAYIALTHFSREKFIEAGLPADRIHVKSNFIHDRYGPDYERKELGEYALFVGRLADEKGVEDLLAAWSKLSIPLVIAGDGPLRDRVCAASNSWIRYAGACDVGQIALLMSKARFLVVPSRWYEVFPMVLLEGFSAGLPVVASRIGSLAELVVEGHTGRLVLPGDPGNLAQTCADLFESHAHLKYMSYNAREEYLTKYTPDLNYRILMDIYATALQSAGTRG